MAQDSDDEDAAYNEGAPWADDSAQSDSDAEGEFSEESFDAQDLEEGKSGTTASASFSRVSERGASRPGGTKRD